MSSLSPSPSPSFNNSASNLHQTTPTSTSDPNSSQERTPTNNPQPTITRSAQLKVRDSPSECSSAAYANSKSILFGIPRDYAPMPTIPAQESYSHASIDSPFVDVTMNNCDDMSLYQPMSKLQLSQGQHQRASNLAPLAESDISQQSKPNSTSSDNYSPAPTPTNLLYSSSAASLPRTNSKNLVSASASNISPHYPYQQQHFQHQSFNDIGNTGKSNASTNSPVGAVCANSSQNNKSNNQMFGNNSQSGLSNASNSQNNFKKQEDPISHMVS